MQLDDMDYELLFRMCHLPAGCPPQLMCWSCFHHTRRHPLMSPFDQVHLEAAQRRQSLLDQFIVLHDRLGTATRKCSVLSKVMSSCAAHSPRFYGSIQIAALVACNGRSPSQISRGKLPPVLTINLQIPAASQTCSTTSGGHAPCQPDR